MAGNLFILRFLVLHHLHRERASWFRRVRVLLERSWKWRGHDFHKFLDALSREIYLEYIIVLWYLAPDIDFRIAWRRITIYLLPHPYSERLLHFPTHIRLRHFSAATHFYLTTTKQLTWRPQLALTKTWHGRDLALFALLYDTRDLCHEQKAPILIKVWN